MLKLAAKHNRAQRSIARWSKWSAQAHAHSASFYSENSRKYPVGLQVHGYNIKQVKPIPEFSLIAVQLEHEKTGSEHLHLDAALDKNNVFLAAFKTNPPDATGVPHILEHTTLCGSHKYPVRDPFFKMLNRSLSNFMNAMTGHDYTFYPFATTNAKDFENLMDVYLSSVFEPLLSHEDFIQEGWRLENEDPSDPQSNLTYKGVVYNEMKGQYSNSAYNFWIKFQESIYPSLNNSGGDPAKITDLEYEDLIEFHSKNYHPSNCKTFTYGSLPLDNHLKKLNEIFLLFGRRNTNPDVKKPLFFTTENSTLEATVSGPPDTMSSKKLSDQHKSSITWSLGDALKESSMYDIFKWKILSSLLCDGHGSPFYQELIEKEYGDDFSVNTGLDVTTSLLSFTIGLNNLSTERVKNLESKVNDIFRNIVVPELEKGAKSAFHEKVLAMLHQIELNFRKHKPDFGIGLLNSLVPSWVNGVDPIKSLEIDAVLKRFKEEFSVEGLKLFKNLLEQTILNPDTKKFIFNMVPDENYYSILENNEKSKLATKISSLDDDDKRLIYERNIKLAENQQKKEDVSVLPTLTLGDIPREGDFYPLEFTNMGPRKVQKRVVDTNGIVYVTAAKDISYIPSYYHKYLPLLNSCFLNLAGTEKNPIADLETLIQKKTGGVTFSAHVTTNPHDIFDPILKFVVSGSSLSQNSQYIYDIWSEILLETKLDKNDDQVIDKMYTLIKNLGQNQLDMIAERGHSYASSYGVAQLTPTKKIKDALAGIEHVEFIKYMNEKLDKKGKDYIVSELLPILSELRLLILENTVPMSSSPGFDYNIVGDRQIVSTNEKLVQQFDEKVLNSVKVNSKTAENQLLALLQQLRKGEVSNTLIDLPYQIGYASLAKLGAAYSTEDGAALQVLSQLLTFKHLHSVIREANGAYGGGLQCDGLGGSLNFFSYRDPNPIESVKSFEEASQIALEKMLDKGGWDKKDLEEAKLSIFQSVDAPMNVASQGNSVFLEGITDKMRQERRERFLDVNYNQLRDVTEKYLLNNNGIGTVIKKYDEKTDRLDKNSWKIKHLTFA